MRFVEFTDTKKWRNSEGAGGAWVFENTAEAATGSWIFGTHRDDLQASCGNGEIVLLGVKPGVTKDNVITVGTITLLFHVNGVPSLRCKYTYNRATKIPDPENIKSPVTLRLRGPVTMENVP